jgi:hypothetical protein
VPINVSIGSAERPIVGGQEIFFLGGFVHLRGHGRTF